MKFNNNSTSLLILLGITLSLSLPTYAAKQAANNNGKQSDTVPNPYTKTSNNKLVKPVETTIKPPSNYIKPPKPVFKPGPVKTKLYKIPGASIIATAKRHGYLFGVDMTAVSRDMNNPNGCRFIGNHWQIPDGKTCGIYGFREPNKKCKKLRKGWTIEKFVWKNFHKNNQWGNTNYLPDGKGGSILHFILTPKNPYNGRNISPVMIQSVTLRGPEGPFNKFEEAFSHCNDPSYRP